MEHERFSYLVEEYYESKEIIPVIISYKPYNCPDLDDLQDKLFNYFNSINNVEIELTHKLKDEFWPGVLIEIKTDLPYSEILLNRIEIYTTIVPNASNDIVGISIGRNAYSSANLESLGKNYFKSII